MINQRLNLFSFWVFWVTALLFSAHSIKPSPLNFGHWIIHWSIFILSILSNNPPHLKVSLKFWAMNHQLNPLSFERHPTFSKCFYEFGKNPCFGVLGSEYTIESIFIWAFWATGLLVKRFHLTQKKTFPQSFDKWIDSCIHFHYEHFRKLWWRAFSVWICV